MNPFDKCEQFIAPNLGTLAREILTWHKTGLLPDGKLRELDGIVRREISDQNSLQIAENLVKHAALKEVSSF